MAKDALNEEVVQMFPTNVIVMRGGTGLSAIQGAHNLLNISIEQRKS